MLWILFYLANQKEEKGDGRNMRVQKENIAEIYLGSHPAMRNEAAQCWGLFLLLVFLVFLGYCDWGIELASLHPLL
jgi:hypothetical protein